MGRAVTDRDKIQGQSLPEIRKAWKQTTLDLSDDPDIREAARGTLRDGDLLCAFTIWCVLQPPEERKKIAEFGLRVLKFLKDSDKPVPLQGRTIEGFRRLMK
jgi:hypothetical protein